MSGGVLVGVEDLVHIGSHVALLEQGCPYGGALGPYRDILRIILVIGICPRIKILKAILLLCLVLN